MSGAPVAVELISRLTALQQRVGSLVASRRASDPNPDDPFRGLYVNDDTVDRLLATGVDVPPTAAAAGEQADVVADRLTRLAVAAGLTELDVDLLVIALAPDLDPRFERLYGYLNDDVSRRRASVALALELAGRSPLDPVARGRFDPSRPLVRHGLLTVADGDRPLLTRALVVPDRVADHLVGDDAVDPVLTAWLAPTVGYAAGIAGTLERVLASGPGAPLVHLRERTGGLGAATATAALTAAGREVVALDLSRSVAGSDLTTVAATALREALLRGAGVIAGPVEAWAGIPAGAEALRRLGQAPVPVFLVGSQSWDPTWADRSPLLLDPPALTAADRTELWQGAIGDVEVSFELAEVTSHLALGPHQIQQAVCAASASARLHGATVGPDDLRVGVRAQNAAGLERLARRIEPEVGWDDLVLAPSVRRGLEDLAARARHRELVLNDWRMRRGGGRGHGVTALFAGDSGTGKTMSAEVIAADLGLDLYTVNLATVVDKYIGETEKNLERIFVEAAGVNAVLFFDEADAIFGKRSDVKDAHDRYANIESAYLLQRLETFDGLAVLATNLRANIDDAFTRRLDAIIDFAAPTAPLRRTLWQQYLAPPLPSGDDIDLDFLADSFELAGGNIRSAATTAAYLAAEAGHPVGMAEMITAVEQEYRKLGRLVLEREFGRYLPARRSG